MGAPRAPLLDYPNYLTYVILVCKATIHPLIHTEYLLFSVLSPSSEAI